MRSLMIFTCLVFSFHSLAGDLTLENYLALFLSQDESLKISKWQTESLGQDQKITADLYASEFHFRAHRNERETIFPAFSSQDFSENRNGLTGRYTQNLSWGMQATIEGTHYSGASNPSLGAIDEEYELRLSQSLWKNPFGALSSTRQIRVTKLKEASELEDRAQLVSSCQKGIDYYLNARAAQLSFEIVQEMEQTSTRALNAASNAYQKKLMREIDFLTAKSEKIQAEDQTVQARNFRDQSMMLLINFSKEKGAEGIVLSQAAFPKLQESDHFFTDLQVTDSKAVLESYSLLALNKQVESAQDYLQQVKFEQRTDILLGVSLGRRKGDVNIGAQVTDYEDETAMFFVEMDWPVFNKSKSGQIQKASLELSKNRTQAQQTQRNLWQSFHQLNLNQEKLAQQIALAEQKVEIYQKQVNQAVRLIDTGRIEMEDFQRYYQRLLQERLALIDYQRKKHSEKAMLSQLGSSLYESCRKLL